MISVVPAIGNPKTASVPASGHSQAQARGEVIHNLQHQNYEDMAQTNESAPARAIAVQASLPAHEAALQPSAKTTLHASVPLQGPPHPMYARTFLHHCAESKVAMP